MPDDVKVPGLGEVPKKYVWGGVIVGGGIAVIMFLRARSAASASDAGNAAASDGTGTDPSIDPATGIPYADEGYGTEDSSYIDPSTGIPYADESGYGGAYGTSVTTANAVSTNEEWLQNALTDTPGNTSTVEAALAGVLGGLTVTTAQREIFLEAVGINGQPPQGYPTPIKTSDTSAQSTTSGTSSNKVSVPDVKGWEAQEGYAMIRQAGLKPHGPTPKAGEHLYIQTETPKPGTSVIKGSAVHLTAKAGTAPKLK